MLVHHSILLEFELCYKESLVVNVVIARCLSLLVDSDQTVGVK